MPWIISQAPTPGVNAGGYSAAGIGRSSMVANTASVPLTAWMIKAIVGKNPY